MSADEMLKAVYDEDCEFIRYHDGLMWSRFQTVTAIEAAMLYGRYQVSSLTLPEKATLLVLGTVLVFLCCLLTFRNREASQVHLDRVKRIEQEAAKSHAILQFKYRKPTYLSADAFLWAVTLLLAVFNILLIMMLFCTRSGPSWHSSVVLW